MLTRRALLGAGAAALVSCGRRKASGFSGYAFIANQEGQAVAAVDLTVFAVARHIRVEGRPTAVAANPKLGLVYALTPENGSLHEIKTDRLVFSRKLTVAASALSMRLSPDGRGLFVLCRQPRRLVHVTLPRFEVDWKVDLPADPFDFELAPDAQCLAISYSDRDQMTMLDLSGTRSIIAIPTAGPIGTVRFRPDSKQLLAANLDERLLAVYDVPLRRLVVNLPLAVKPTHLCFNADGGQLFVTGEGMDAVVVVYPYFMPRIGETVLAGHSPSGMAASNLTSTSPQFLFVSNPASGEVSILDIDTRRVVAVTPVGAAPGYILVTPDDRYALVLNEGSGDLAVIRIANIVRAVSQQRRSRKGAIFMMVPVGSKPVSATVMAI